MNDLIVEFVVTEECNLRCTYCYMKNQPKYAGTELIKLFKDNVGTLLDIYGAQKYTISYFGGEPLLNWEFIKEAYEDFRVDPRCSSQMVITNGLLLDDAKVAWIKEHPFGISLSFDGLWNSINRPLRSGVDSLPLYVKKREIFNKLGIQGCKTMVGPQSIPTLVENFKFFYDEFGMTPDYSLVRDDVWSWSDVVLFREKVKELADEVISRFLNGSQATVGFFTLMLLDMFAASKYGKRPFGCFAGCHGVGFLPSGIFYPCARYGSINKYPILDATTGEVFSDNINKLKCPEVSDPKAYAGCFECEIRAYCNGGCNKSFLDKGMDAKAEPIPQLCELYKAISRETLRIHQELKDNKIYQSYVKSAINGVFK